MAGLLVAVVASLQAFAAGTERVANLYPMSGEGWLRVLVPSLWSRSDDTLLLLAGPSTAREDFRVGQLARAFPLWRVRQGGLSLGTLGDMMAELEYIERQYGSAALPDILVMGTSVRFLAEIPDERPLADGLRRFSPVWYIPEGRAAGFGLERKFWLRGRLDHAAFLLGKQGSRYRTALWYRAARLVGEERSDRFGGSRVAGVLTSTGLARLLGVEPLIDPGIWHLGMDGTMPYRYEHLAPLHPNIVATLLDDPDSWWRDVYRWDPAAAGPYVAQRIAALRRYLTRHGIDLYVVNLPEHSLSRSRYQPGLAERYDSLAQGLFADLPYLDLRCAIPDSAFYDAEHLLPPAARDVTQRVITFVRSRRGSPGPATRNGSCAGHG